MAAAKLQLISGHRKAVWAAKLCGETSRDRSFLFDSSLQQCMDFVVENGVDG